MQRQPWITLAVLALCAGCAATARPTAALTPTPESVAWKALPPSGVIPQPPSPSPAPQAPIPSGTPECTASQLDVMAGMGNGATGHTNMPIDFRNRGSSGCFLQGYPDVTIRDSTGRILAQASGTAGRGTFFDVIDWVEPVLMDPGTQFAGGVRLTPPRGQAYVNIEWWDCALASATRIDVVLPAGGGTLSANYTVRAGYSPGCDGGSVARSGVLRSQFIPTGFQLPPFQYLPVSLSIDAPKSVRRGSTLEYYVTIRNDSTTAYYRLTPCPDYVEIVGLKTAVAEYALNCGPVGQVGPGASERFEMRLQIPPSMPVGLTSLRWMLNDFRIAVNREEATVTVT